MTRSGFKRCSKNEQPTLAIENSLFVQRFLGEWLIQAAIDNALASGKACTLSLNELQGRKVMRVAGGLNAGLRNDFIHNLTKVGVDELDLSCVTQIDSEGLDLYRIAVQQHRVGVVQLSACVRAKMDGHLVC